MTREHVLSWVQRNRVKRERTQRAGAGIRRLVENVVGPLEPARMQTIVATLARVLDDECRSSCRWTLSDAQTLTIIVDAPAMIPVLRRRWESILLRELAASKGVRITRVNFTYGTAGGAIRAAERIEGEPNRA